MKFRTSLKITSRKSSITNSFVQAIIPTIPASKEQRAEALAQLGLTDGNLSCVYCGEKTSDWDHLRPLVKGRMPTGYISDVKNLVPSCGPCNQSKGASDWKEWMEGNAKRSPATKRLSDLAERVARIEAFVIWGAVEPIPLQELVPPDIWQDYWDHLTAITESMIAAQQKAEVVARYIASSHKITAASIDLEKK